MGRDDCPSMNCRRAAELLLDFLDGELELAVSQELELHLHACQPCKVLVGTYKKTTILCRKALLAHVPADLEDRLVSFLRSQLAAKTN